MGGHGTWHIGTLFPDRFAAIGPSAGWPFVRLTGEPGGRPVRGGRRQAAIAIPSAASAIFRSSGLLPSAATMALPLMTTCVPFGSLTFSTFGSPTTTELPGRVGASGATTMAVVYTGSGTIKVGDVFAARVDAERRARTVRNHSATHLMHKALREVLGAHVQQKGSLVNAERTRFDFAHNAPMTAEQINKVEAYRPQSSFSDAVKGLLLYGAKNVRPDSLASALVTVS